MSKGPIMLAVLVSLIKANGFITHLFIWDFKNEYFTQMQYLIPSPSTSFLHLDYLIGMSVKVSSGLLQLGSPFSISSEHLHRERVGCQKYLTKSFPFVVHFLYISALSAA
jgi:hypothetical protein